MSVEDTRTQVRAMYEQFNRDRLDALDTLLAPDFVDHDPDNPTHDAAGVRQFFEQLLAAFPDFRFEVDDVLVDGDRAAAFIRLTGTHQGDFQGIPASGRRMDVRGVDLFRLRGAQVTEHWSVFDSLGLMQQLGAFPTQGQNAAAIT